MKQAKRIIAVVLCLLALLALPAGAVMEKGEPNITTQTTMKEVRNNPGIKNSGFRSSTPTRRIRTARRVRPCGR